MIRYLCYFPIMILVGIIKYPLALIAPLFGIYLDINIGWKEHDGFPRAMYANRLIAFRKR